MASTFVWRAGRALALGVIAMAAVAWIVTPGLAVAPWVAVLGFVLWVRVHGEAPS